MRIMKGEEGTTTIVDVLWAVMVMLMLFVVLGFMGEEKIQRDMTHFEKVEDCVLAQFDDPTTQEELHQVLLACDGLDFINEFELSHGE